MNDAAEVLRVVAALTVIALVLFLVAMVSRSARAAIALLRPGRLVEVVETIPLPHANSLHVVKIADAYYAIGCAHGGICLLTDIPPHAIERHKADAPAGSPLLGFGAGVAEGERGRAPEVHGCVSAPRTPRFGDRENPLGVAFTKRSHQDQVAVRKRVSPP